MQRPIIEIDNEKCNGCGQCILNCAEGALGIVNGKATLLSETYCDGLGACLDCPQGALRIVQREAKEFNEQEALAAKAQRAEEQLRRQDRSGGCPGSAVRTLRPLMEHSTPQNTPDTLRACLPSWPVQLRLVPSNAPFLRNASVLLAAHCAGFALPKLHSDWLSGRIPLIACPKLEDKHLLAEKLTELLRDGGMARLDILRMHVPCCGLDRLADMALKTAHSAIVPRCHVVQM
ncbi:MAG: ferredoxin [Desulfovibrio sp.]|nr:ferredoxin [Desulfovibrio sp.]